MTTPSHLQQAIFDHVADSTKGNLVVIARAGTGKTWTIIEAMAHVPAAESVAVFAFNKAIAAELTDRVPEGVVALTFHSLGLRACTQAFGRLRVDGGKVTAMVDKRMGRDWETRTTRTAIVKLVGLAKNTLATEGEDLDNLIDAFQLDLPCTCTTTPHMRSCARRTAIDHTQAILEACRNPGDSLDFDDMIWLPVVNDLAVQTFDRVFVDETQDLNATQLRLAIKACRAGGRIVAVGDDRQAIYAFRGAASGAIASITRELSADVLPLSICYRCPRTVVELAATVVPDFQVAPGAAEGVIESISYDTMLCDVRPGDFVLSRSNAPLVSACLRLIRQGVKATIKGRDIGAGLVTWLLKVKCRGVDGLRERITEWHDREIERLCKQSPLPESLITAADDRADTLLALCDGASTVPEVIARAEALFVDDGDSNGRVILSSTHKAKGLERDRVFMLAGTYRKRATTEEENLWYVAVTRAKRELFLVADRPV
jgi:DNA helicase-2/ATP-dependent DNA helicase PcrA